VIREKTVTVSNNKKKKKKYYYQQVKNLVIGLVVFKTGNINAFAISSRTSTRTSTGTSQYNYIL
jgi:hypothetical protein